MYAWILQDAKARFSELVQCAVAEGPQLVTRHGVPTVVVVPLAEYDRLSRPRLALGDFFRSAPRAELNIARSPELPRELDL